MRTLRLLLVGLGLASLWAVGCGGRTEMGLPIIADAPSNGGAAGAGGDVPGAGGSGGAWTAGGGWTASGGWAGSGAWTAGGAWPVAGAAGSGAWTAGGAWNVGGSPAGGGGWYTGGSWPVAGGAAGSGAAGGATGTCESVCDMILTKCPRSDPTCAPSCEEQRAMYPQCNYALDIFIACVERNGVKCGPGTNVTVAGCSVEMNKMDACLNTAPPVPPQCAAFPPPPSNVACVGSGTAGGAGSGGGAGSTTYAPLCISSCFAGGKTWTSTCQAGKCDCAFNDTYVCTCATTQPDPCVPCCPGMY